MLRHSYSLTSVSPVYSEDPLVHQRTDSVLMLLIYSMTDLALSGVRGLISELKPEQHNLHLWLHNHSTCREQWYSSVSTAQISRNFTIRKRDLIHSMINSSSRFRPTSTWCLRGFNISLNISISSCEYHKQTLEGQRINHIWRAIAVLGGLGGHGVSHSISSDYCQFDFTDTI